MRTTLYLQILFFTAEIFALPLYKAPRTWEQEHGMEVKREGDSLFSETLADAAESLVCAMTGQCNDE